MSLLLVVVLVPLVGALIGWATNYLAIKMLFHPRREIHILGFRFQGVVPKRQDDIAQSIGEMVQRELISVEDVTKVIGKANLKDEIANMVNRLVDEKVKPQLATGNPMLALIPADIFDRLKGVISQGMLDDIDIVTGKLVKIIESDIDFKALVVDRIHNFDVGKMEDLVLGITSREFKHIERLGGVIGGVIGVVQLGILALLGQLPY